MTHDELLAKVDSVFYEDEGGTQLDLAGFNNQYRALRAVVELHKPDMRGNCDICSWIAGGFVVHSVCPTIQAIEKELQ
jgi:hypothetical protein